MKGAVELCMVALRDIEGEEELLVSYIGEDELRGRGGCAVLEVSLSM